VTQCTATHCTALHCNALQHTATHFVTSRRHQQLSQHLMRVCCSVLQCVAVCCSVLQCVAVCCSVLQVVAVCCSVLQCVALPRVLQCVAVGGCCSTSLALATHAECERSDSTYAECVLRSACCSVCCSTFRVCECAATYTATCAPQHNVEPVFRGRSDSGRQQVRQNFSELSSPLHLLYKIITELTF